MTPAWRHRKDIFTNDQLPYPMNDEAVYRAAPATPGLLKKTFVDCQIPQYELVTLTLDKRK